MSSNITETNSNESPPTLSSSTFLTSELSPPKKRPKLSLKIPSPFTETPSPALSEHNIAILSPSTQGSPITPETESETEIVCQTLATDDEEFQKFLTQNNFKLGPAITSGEFGSIYRLEKIKEDLPLLINGKAFEAPLFKEFQHPSSDFPLTAPDHSLSGEHLSSLFYQNANGYIPLSASIYRNKETGAIVTSLSDEILSSSEALAVYEQIGLITENSGQSLTKFLEENSLTAEDKNSLAKEILKAMHTLEELGIIHRDIKPENILVKRNSKGFSVSVIDFGLAKKIDTSNKEAPLTPKKAGTIAYSAPEFISPRCSHGFKADAWSVGLVLWRLFENAPRLTGQFHEGHNLSVSHLPLDFKNTPEEYRFIIRSLLIKNPIDRISIGICLELLEEFHSTDISPLLPDEPMSSPFSHVSPVMLSATPMQDLSLSSISLNSSNSISSPSPDAPILEDSFSPSPITPPLGLPNSTSSPSPLFEGLKNS